MAPPTSDADEPVTREALQRVMTREAGVLRDATSLGRASKELGGMAGRGDGGFADRRRRSRSLRRRQVGHGDPEVRNLVTVSSALVDAALARTESRGTHTRLDFPEPSSGLLGRFVFAGGEPHPELVRLPSLRGRELHQRSGGS